MNFKIEGIDKLNKNISLAATKYIPRSSARALLRLLLKVKLDAQRRTPVDKNRLKPSARTDIVKSNAYGVYGTVSFHTRYAAYVHERTGLRHAPGKEAKFLENAVKLVAPKMARELGVAIWSDFVAKFPRSGGRVRGNVFKSGGKT